MNPIVSMLTCKLNNLAYNKLIQIANEEGRCRELDCWVIPMYRGEEVLIEYAWYVQANKYNYIVIYKDMTIFDDGYDTNIIDGYHYVDGKKYRIEENYIGEMTGTRFLSRIIESPLYEFCKHECV